MESASKRPRTVPFSSERVLELLEEDRASDDGMSSSEESDLDRELQNSSEESGDEEITDVPSHEDDGDVFAHVEPVVPAAPVVPAVPVAGRGIAVGRAAAAPAACGLGAGPAGRGRGRGAARPAAPAGRGHVAARPAGQAARGCGVGRRRNAAAPIAFQTYSDPDVGNRLPPFTPNRPTGIHFGRPHLRNTMTTALEFFHLYFTPDMISNICTHTNSYANEHIITGTNQSYTKSDGSWQYTTPDEINRLIALLIYMGIVKVSHTEKYWSIKSLYSGLWASAIMSRSRFKALMALLHVVDPGAENPGDKLRKVDSFIDYFKSRCLALYQPRQQLAIDERMVRSRHKSGIRQYIRDKPTKWGIKLWVVADSSNGYTIDFDVYIGKAAGRDVSVHGLGYDVVVKLMQPFLRQGYHLYIDNFYTSTTLVKYLFQEGVPTTGTLRENRRGFPANMKNGREWSKAPNVDRGSMRWERDPPVLALQWLDNKVVSMLTTIENANDSLQVRRKTKTAGAWSTKVVKQPKAIATYNKYMNGVDRSDQILATYNVLRRCKRWWKVLFFHLIDIAVVNSYILFREHQAQFPDFEELRRPKEYSLLQYRAEIVRQICGFPEYSDPPVRSAGRPVSPHEFESVHMPVFGEERRNCVVCYKKSRVQQRVFSKCSADQCEGKHMHVTKDKNCFLEFHSREYHSH